MAAQRPSTVRSAAFAQQRLELGEGVLDRVEVGAVGRQVAQLCAGGLDHLAHARPLVARRGCP